MPNPGSMDITQEAVRESDKAVEKIGEVDEARFRAAPNETRSETEQALARAFPEPERDAARKT
ncbi:MAG: hypothetical protein AB1714_21615 [Acidobacteriota bacterium]